MGLNLKYSLRGYQEQIVSQAMGEMAKNDKPFIITAACGSGKSLMIAEFASRLTGRTLVLQPSLELLKQNTEKMMNYTDDVKVYSASAGKKEIGNVTMATLGSIKNVKEFELFDNLIIDECDYGFNIEKADSMFMQFVERCNFKVIAGFTATPYRMRTRVDHVRGIASQQIVMLNRIPMKGNSRYGTFFWGRIVGKVETQELLDQHFLTPVQYYTERPECASVLQVNKSGNEYTDESLDEFGNHIVGRAVKAAEYVLIDKKLKQAIIYLPSIKSSQAARKTLIKAGFTAEVISAGTKKADRVKIIDNFKAENIQVLLNVNTLTTGFDHPPLSAIVMARPTLSVRLYYQTVGRVMRTHDDKDVAHVFDIAGNVKTFGRVEALTLAKEDGWKDCLMSENGRMDNITLSQYSINSNKKQSASSDLKL